MAEQAYADEENPDVPPRKETAMTKCDEALRLLERLVEVAETGRGGHQPITEARAFLTVSGGVATCDAEKAVLAGTLQAWMDTLIVLDNQPKRTELIELKMQTYTVLADTSPAAAALLAQGERLREFEDKILRLNEQAEGDYEFRVSVLAAIAPSGEEKE